MASLVQLADNLYVHCGAINVGILQDGQRALLIDFGDGDVESALHRLGIEHIDAVLFTHHHRDQASGVAPWATAGTRIGVPEAERAWFEDVESYWRDPQHRWHIYDFRPHNLMLASSIPIHETYKEGDTFTWGPATILVLETPGHTEGSISYQLRLPSAEGDRCFLFCGDVLYGDGQIWDLYSLQKGWHTRDYHGFMGDRTRLLQSLDKLRTADADTFVPSHGPVVANPARSIELLRDRLGRCYDKYVAISALRHYFPDLFAHHQGLADAMPIREALPCPDFLYHLGTTWVVSSREGAAFVLDCGSSEVIQGIRELQSIGRLGPVEWLWITHYHDDHVDAIPQFVETFGYPIVTDKHVAQVAEHPLSWRLPCISPVRVSLDRRTTHGESWRWHEFQVTAYHLPGQTLYHGGLLVEGRGMRILFAGDSFTMAGIDDYCMGNRNFLGQGMGFDACLALVDELQPDLILNCHVDRGFRFRQDDCRFMRANLAEREQLYGELLPWDNPNYGLDEHWIRCHPYEQQIVPGENVQLAVVITNHSSEEREVVCRLVLPEQWQVQVRSQKAVVPPKTEEKVPFSFTVPNDAQPGRYVVPADVTYHARHLGQFREAILVIGANTSFKPAVPCT